MFLSTRSSFQSFQFHIRLLKCIFYLQARDVYEEALRSVMTVRDFTQVFDSYAQYEELMLNKRMAELGDNVSEEDDIDLELRFEFLNFIFNILFN